MNKDFEKLRLPAMKVETLLRKYTPWNRRVDPSSSAGPADAVSERLPLPPDIFVVDAEGYDAVLVNALLDYVEQLDKQQQEQQDYEQLLVAGKWEELRTWPTVAAIQYEHKHLARPLQSALVERLRRMGYAVQTIFGDTLAVRVAVGVKGSKERRQWWPPEAAEDAPRPPRPTNTARGFTSWYPHCGLDFSVHPAALPEGTR
jgi:hypothetical protein